VGKKIVVTKVRGAIARLQLDHTCSQLYADLNHLYWSEAARQALQTMDPATHEYQSEFDKRYVAELDAIGERLLTAETLQEALL
jgi:hypothetical protein